MSTGPSFPTLGRRRLLASIAASTGALLVACGAPAAPSPTAAPAKAPAPPAATPTAAAAAAEAPKAAPTQAPAAPTQAPTAAPATAASPTPAAAKPAGQAAAALTFGAWADNPQIEILNDIVAAYEKARPNTKINKQFAGWTEYWQKLQTQIASNTAPDMLMMSVAYIGNFVAKGTVLNLDPYVAGQKLDLSKYVPVDVSTWQFGPKARVGGKGPLYALSFDASINSSFFYNKTLFDKAKIPLPTDKGDRITIVYSDSDDGRTQKLLIASSELRFGNPLTLGDTFTVGADTARCIVKGRTLTPIRLPLKPSGDPVLQTH